MTGAVAAESVGGGPVLVISADPLNATKITVTPNDATASITFKRNGDVTNHNGTVVATWIAPAHSTIGDNYKVKFQLSSGTYFTSSAAADNTYTTDISADRTFTQTETTNGAAEKTCTGTWTVANSAATITDTAAGTVTATVTV